MRLFNRRGNLRVGDTEFPTRINFKVEKTAEGRTANKCSVQIYNLAPASKALIEEKAAPMQILAGYEEGVETIFLGDIATAITERRGADLVTVVEGGDGQNAISDATLQFTFKGEVTVARLIDEVKASLGVVTGSIKGLQAQSFKKGFTWSSKASELLDQLVKGQGLQWSIRDGALQITPEGEDTGEEAVLLSPSTGLIGTPGKTENGFTAKALLNGQIQVGRLVKLESKEITGTGFFKVVKATHEGDTKEGPWFTTMEGTSFG